ncbi:MAG: hypothetical protein JWO67_2245 [Streptosporangiaceae bacterium]|nr:hypothetical protein [Streptosporangiaceae bacterium]
MATNPISASSTVKLSALGAGQCSLTPPSGVMWQLSLASLSIANPVNIPSGFLYTGNSNGPIQLIDSTYAGASASSGKVAGVPFYPGIYLWAVWSGGDALATATLQVFGTAVSNYRRAAVR